MSAGSFTRSKYESNNGDIHPIRVQPETLTAQFGSTANSAPAGAINNPISARVSNGNRQFGLKPRTATITFGASPPTGYKAEAYIRIPILQESLWNTLSNGTTLTYLGSAATVVGTSPERVR